MATSNPAQMSQNPRDKRPMRDNNHTQTDHQATANALPQFEEVNSVTIRRPLRDIIVPAVADAQYLLFTPTMTGKDAAHRIIDGDNATKQGEWKFIESSCVEQATHRYRQRVDMGKSTVLARMESFIGDFRPVSAADAASSYKVAVAVWKGLRYPTEFDNIIDGTALGAEGKPISIAGARPKQIFLSKNHDSKSHWRWSLIALFPNPSGVTAEVSTANRAPKAKRTAPVDSIGSWLVEVQAAFGSDDQTLLSTVQVTVNVRVSIKSLSDLCTLQPSTDSQINIAAGRAILQMEHANGGDLIVHGDKVFDPSNDHVKHASGLVLHRGLARALDYDADDVLIATESHCVRVFLAPGTVAAFMVEFYGIDATESALVSHHESLNKALNGVRVAIPGLIGARTIRTVQGVSRSNFATTDNTSRHESWPVECSTSYLPCLNVGTVHRPRLLPAELCVILPMQVFKGPLSQRLSKKLQILRKDFLSQPIPADASLTVAQEKITLTRKPDIIPVLTAPLFSKFLFVMPDPVQSEDSLWMRLCRYLLKGETALPEPSVQTQVNSDDFLKSRMLSLRPMHGAYDAELWTAQLDRFVKDRREQAGPDGLDFVVVICLPSNVQHRKAYQILKKACDIDIGVHSISVNYASLAKRMDKSAKSGVRQSASNIQYRLTIQSKSADSVFVATRGQAPDLAFAADVSQIPIDGSVDSSGETFKQFQMCLVSLVCVESDTNGRYWSEIKLVSIKDVRDGKVQELLAKFVTRVLENTDNTSMTRNITVLRSGTMSSHEQQLRPGFANSDHKKLHENLALQGGNVELAYVQLSSGLAIQSCIPPGIMPREGQAASSITGDLFFRCNPKSDDLRSILAQRGGSTNSSAVLLTITKKQVRGQVKTPSHFNLPAPQTDRLFVLGGPKPRNPSQSYRVPTNSDDAASVLIHDRPESSGSGDSGVRSKKPWLSSPSKTIGSTSPTHDSLDAESVQEKVDNVLPRSDEHEESAAQYPGPTPVDLTDAIVIPPPQKNDGSSDQSSSPAMSPTFSYRQTEMQRFARLWQDDTLQLHSTKWPIATHLAHLVAKRAKLHLEGGQYKETITEYVKSSNGQNSDTTRKTLVVPITLPEVHARLRNTLYYL